MKVFVLALNDVFDTGLATVTDAFVTANELAEMSGIASLRFDLSIVGVRRKIKTAQGLTVPVVPAPERATPDLVIVPALGFKTPDTLEPALARAEVCEATEMLRHWAAKKVRIAAACIGTFVLGESGLLDDQEATTTWWLAPLFRRRYPKVRIDESRIIVSSGQFVTAGAALSHLDMALWLIRRVSPELAALTARYLIVDTRPSQAAYIIPSHLANADPVVERFERWARRRLAHGFSLDAAARATATSTRTLARRMQKVLGKSPLSYFQDLRVERAVHLLKVTSDGVDEIAAKVGYADGVALRLLLRRRLGRGIRELRPRPETLARIA
ncbi:MAG TPA: helix-turn-helix domain-containing protein [Candidatus Binataceae bacterium]|nr:helix-turn-helix domain-containing protein [Candidatus Binataceae bacterium]